MADAKMITTDEDVATPITLTYTIAPSPECGEISGTPPNVVYTPTNEYHGADSFTDVASNAATNSEPATVTITITR